jgi:biopolymer transport protein ExbD
MAGNVGGGGVDINIVITPMLDMSFQLLAFFVMTYHPNALEGHIDGNLLPPRVENVAIKSKNITPPKPEDKPPIPVDEIPKDPPDVITVVIKAVAKGENADKGLEGTPTGIKLRRAESAAEPISDREDFKVALQKLAAELKKIQANPSGNDLRVFIEADGNLRNQYVVQVYDVCKKAKFKTVGFQGPGQAASGGQ